MTFFELMLCYFHSPHFSSSLSDDSSESLSLTFPSASVWIFALSFGSSAFFWFKAAALSVIACYSMAKFLAALASSLVFISASRFSSLAASSFLKFLLNTVLFYSTCFSISFSVAIFSLLLIPLFSLCSADFSASSLISNWFFSITFLYLVIASQSSFSFFNASVSDFSF